MQQAATSAVPAALQVVPDGQQDPDPHEVVSEGQLAAWRDHPFMAARAEMAPMGMATRSAIMPAEAIEEAARARMTFDAYMSKW